MILHASSFSSFLTPSLHHLPSSTGDRCQLAPLSLVLASYSTTDQLFFFLSSLTSGERCQLAPSPSCARFLSPELNDFVMALFKCIASAAVAQPDLPQVRV